MTISKNPLCQTAKEAFSETSLEAIKVFCKEKQGRVAALAAATASTRPEVSRWFGGGRRPRPEKLQMMAQWMKAEQEAEAAQKQERAAAIKSAIDSLRPPRKTIPGAS